MKSQTCLGEPWLSAEQVSSTSHELSLEMLLTAADLCPTDSVPSYLGTVTTPSLSYNSLPPAPCVVSANK